MYELSGDEMKLVPEPEWPSNVCGDLGTTPIIRAVLLPFSVGQMQRVALNWRSVKIADTSHCQWLFLVFGYRRRGIA